MEAELVRELARLVHDRDIVALDALRNKSEDEQWTRFMAHSATGLSANEVETRGRVFGTNVLPVVRRKLFVEFLWEAAQDRILLLLAGAAVVSLAVHWRSGGWIEGVAILVAVGIVVLVNAGNDWHKDGLFRALNERSQAGIKTRVRRNGQVDLVSVQELTVGDVLVLEPGNIVPADAILLHQTHVVVVDESSATGESHTLAKSPDADPFLLSGTKLMDGAGEAVVVAVGEASFHGKMMMAMRSDVELTPLQLQLNDLANAIAKYGLLLAGLLLAVLMVRTVARKDALLPRLPDYLIAAITVVVVAVPEGLPMAVTLALAFATSRMLRDNNLVRVLASCETMGRVTSICSDKTGTLTENRMTVVRGVVAGEDANQLADQPASAVSELVAEGIAVNSTAFETVNHETGATEFVGSTTETALLRHLQRTSQESYVLLRHRTTVCETVPFSSVRKLMITVVARPEMRRVHLKGAAEIVLGMCTHMLRPSGAVSVLTEEDEREIRRVLADMAGDALRNIALAYAEVAGGDTTAAMGDQMLLGLEYIWIGVLGIEDPLRAGVCEAVATCQRAGIFVRMVTGDCRETGESIARRCGILMRGGLVMEGEAFRALDDDQLVPRLGKLQVLARSSPLDKQRLVRLLREQLGEIVAVTGDGSNDGPALRAAHVGFSMGITGTQLAQEASSIVLLDDNFASIVKAASWGRCITRSVRKFLQFQLTVNVSAVVTAIVTAVTTAASVLTAVQMLWVNLIMDSLGALALATDVPTADLLARPPEPPGSALITRPMAWHIGSQASLQLAVCLGLFYSLDTAENDRVLRAFTFNTFVFLQLFNELNCRALSDPFEDGNVARPGRLWRVCGETFDVRNWLFWLIWWGTVAGQAVIVQWGGRVFGTVPLSGAQWGQSLLLAAICVPLSLLMKLLRPWRLWGQHAGEASAEPRHPTREQLAWQSAVHGIRARRQFYSAIRRRVTLTNVRGGGEGDMVPQSPDLLLK